MFALKRLEPQEVRVWDGGGGSFPPLQPARWTEGDAAVGEEATQCCVATAMSGLRRPRAAWLLSSSLPTRAWVTASCTGLAIRGAPGVPAFYPQAPRCRHLVLKYPELEPRTLHSYFFPGKEVRDPEPGAQPSATFPETDAAEAGQGRSALSPRGGVRARLVAERWGAPGIPEPALALQPNQS